MVNVIHKKCFLKILGLTFILLALSLPANAKAEIVKSKKAAYGMNYNVVEAAWEKQKIYIYAQDNGDFILVIQAGLGDIRGFVGKSEYSKFKRALIRARRLAEKARNKKKNVSKDLGEFYRIKKVNGSKFRDGVSMKFSAKDNGSQPNLVLEVIDMGESFFKTTLYFDYEKIEAFIGLVEEVPALVKTAKQKKKNSK